MKWNWQWFLGGRVMFWVSTIILAIFIGAYIVTYLIDPTTTIFMNIKDDDAAAVEEIMREYLDSLEVIIEKPVCCRFVEYKHEDRFTSKCDENTILLGTFHEWNNVYFIDISTYLKDKHNLFDTVRHETRHMLVQELKHKKIIDLTEYTEDIAQENNEIYNELFECGIKLLKEEQNHE